MTRTIIWIAALAFACACAPRGVFGEEGPALSTQQERMSYAIGVDLAKSLKRAGIELDPDALREGLQDVLAGEPLMLTATDIRLLLRKYYAESLQGQAKTLVLTKEENRKAAEEFFAKNASAPGVVTLPSGLQYTVLAAGDGPTPGAESRVECNFRGMLLDGTEFDSSYPTGRPATLEIPKVLPGLREGLLLMPSGSRWKLFVPPSLAYGERPAGQEIGPNSALIYEVELVAVR